MKIAELKGRKANGDEGLWMYLDSGASRSVISETSPLITHLYNLSETSGSCKCANHICVDVAVGDDERCLSAVREQLEMYVTLVDR